MDWIKGNEEFVLYGVGSVFEFGLPIKGPKNAHPSLLPKYDIPCSLELKTSTKPEQRWERPFDRTFQGELVHRPVLPKRIPFVVPTVFVVTWTSGFKTQTRGVSVLIGRLIDPVLGK